MPKFAVTHAIREIHKQIKRSWNAIDKKVPLPPCTTFFREKMQLPYAYELDWLMYQDKPIPIEFIHWHWRFARCPDWDSRRDYSDAESEPNASSQYTSPTANQPPSPPGARKPPFA